MRSSVLLFACNQHRWASLLHQVTVSGYFVSVIKAKIINQLHGSCYRGIQRLYRLQRCCYRDIKNLRFSSLPLQKVKNKYCSRYIILMVPNSFFIKGHYKKIINIPTLLKRWKHWHQVFAGYSLQFTSNKVK